MSSILFYDSDDERDSFDVERRQIEKFQRNFLSASFESSSDDEESFIDGTKIPSSTKFKNRARHLFFDLSSQFSQEEEQEKFQPNDIYEQDEKCSKLKIRKPTKAAVLETERKMQQLSRAEQLVLPKFIPKPLSTLKSLEKRTKQELINENSTKNFSINSSETSTAASTLVDLTKLIQDKPTTTNTLNKLSRFLNPDLLKKKPTISNISIIDLNQNKKQTNHPTVKSTINVSLDFIKSPSSNKKLFEMQKQLGIRLRAKRAAMLAENTINLPTNEEKEEEEEINEESTDSSSETNSEILSTTEKENEILQVDEETRHALSDDENIEEEQEEEKSEEEEEKENTNPNRPSLKTILTRMETSQEPEQIQPADPNGETEWFDSSRPAEMNAELELLCSGAFGGENAIPLSQNYTNVQPMNFTPLPPTQIDDELDVEVPRPKVRQLIDDDDETNDIEEEEEEVQEEEEGEEVEDNEELIDYKKQLFEMEAEESGSEIDEKDKENDDENDSEENEEPDEELQKFIDSTAVELDEDEVDNLAKVHLKIKAKEDEQQLKLLKEQYLDFDGDDDGRKIKISKIPMDEEDENDPDYNSEADEEDDEEEDEDNQVNIKDRISELERQRSLQDNQAEELHLDEDLDNIGQHSSMFQKGLALKQKKILTTTTTLHIETSSEKISDLNRKKQTNQTRSVTLSSVLLAKRFSSTLLAPIHKNNSTINNLNNSNESSITTKKQHNPRRHVFSTNNPNENQNPIQTTTSTGEKRSNSSEKSPKTNIKRFKQSTTITKESSTSVFSALAFSNTHRLNNQ